MKNCSMKFQLFLIVMVFLFCGCESEDDIISVTMQDGNTITTNSSQRYYPDEDEFVHGVSFAFARSYDIPRLRKWSIKTIRKAK